MDNSIEKPHLSSGSRTESEKLEPIKVGRIFDKINQPTSYATAQSINEAIKEEIS